jgi:hypothetical protein
VSAAQSALLPLEAITDCIALVRGQKVLIDSDLATLYGVQTKRFNEAVKRNLARFPADFMFQLTAEEFAALRSQAVTSSESRGGRRYLPRAFTEHGAIMAASVLSSPRAIEVSMSVVRAFVRLRELALIRTWPSGSMRWRRRRSCWPCSTRPSAATRACN